MRKLKSSNGNSYALVDDHVYAFVSKFIWTEERRKNNLIYFSTCLKSKKVYLHRLIPGLFGGFHVDHKSRNSLDNTLVNLDLTTASGNALNSIRPRKVSKYRGVSRKINRFTAALTCQGRVYRSGGHLTEEAAGRAYDELAIKYVGAKAILNFSKDFK